MSLKYLCSLVSLFCLSLHRFLISRKNCCSHTCIFCFSLLGERPQHALSAKPFSPGSARWTRLVRQTRRYTRRPFLVELQLTSSCSLMKTTTLLDHRWALCSTMHRYCLMYFPFFQCSPAQTQRAVCSRGLLPVPQPWAGRASTELQCLPITVGTQVLPWSSTDVMDVHTLPRSTEDIPTLSLGWILEILNALIRYQWVTGDSWGSHDRRAMLTELIINPLPALLSGDTDSENCE